MRRLAMAVLLMQMIVTGLAIPIAVAVLEIDYRPILFVLALQFVAIGALRTARGKYIGWFVEILAVLAAIGSWAWFSLNVIFLFLWFLAVRWGERIDDFQRTAETA